MPGAFDGVAQPKPPLLVESLLQHRHATFEPVPCPGSQLLPQWLFAQQARDRRMPVAPEQHQAIGQGQAAPRRAQHADPGRAIAEVRQRARQCQQVEYGGTRAQRIDIGRLEADASPRQFDHDVEQVAAALHENRDARVGPGRVTSLDDVGDRPGLGAPAAAQERVDLHAPFVGRLRRRHAFRILHGAAQHVVMRRQHAGEALIDPLHDRLRRAEIHAQRQRLECDVAEPAVAHVEEQADIRVAEAVDRLHGIADQEQRAAVTALPACCQALQQLHLRFGGVLELVDQHVPQPRIEGKRGVGRLVGCTERLARSRCEFGIVRRLAIGEDRFQLSGREPQHEQQRLEHGPLRVFVFDAGAARAWHAAARTVLRAARTRPPAQGCAS